MVEIGQGSKKAIAETIQSMGANNLLVMPGQATSGGISYGTGQGDGQTGVSFQGGQINSFPTQYFVFGLGCGGQFDFFGK